MTMIVPEGSGLRKDRAPEMFVYGVNPSGEFFMSGVEFILEV